MQPDVGAARLAHHFPDAPTQEHAARLGMWIFLATEILLFTALFTGYSLYRYLFSQTFHAASRYVETSIGLANTVVLITSSLTVALGFHAARQGQGRRAAALLLVTVALGGVFMVLKGFEYHRHFVTGQLPGRYYSFAGLAAPGAAMFFTVYFLMTGLHGVHVLVGMGVLGWLAARAWRGEFSPAYHTPVELGGLYWHLVDVIWIFLFPLLYLV
jgi:cytochrome c oxidase subunit 3